MVGLELAATMGSRPYQAPGSHCRTGIRFSCRDLCNSDSLCPTILDSLADKKTNGDSHMVVGNINETIEKANRFSSFQWRFRLKFRDQWTWH